MKTSVIHNVTKLKIVTSLDSGAKTLTIIDSKGVKTQIVLFSDNKSIPLETEIFSN